MSGVRRKPDGPWIMLQSWLDLLFAHWPLPAGTLRPLVPERLAIDEFDGNAWIAITPFELAGLRLRFLPPLPGTARFPELNLRTYVRFEERPGIFFFTLDAASRLAVLGARAFYGLPYRHARMQLKRADGWIEYRSARLDGQATFEGRYRPVGEGFEARSGSLEHFLTERYSLFTVRGSGHVFRGDITHAPWRLQPAEARIEWNTIAAAQGIQLPASPPLLHFAARQDTHIFAPRRVG